MQRVWKIAIFGLHFISEVIQDRAIVSLLWMRIGNRTQAFEWYHDLEWLSEIFSDTIHCVTAELSCSIIPLPFNFNDPDILIQTVQVLKLLDGATRSSAIADKPAQLSLTNRAMPVCKVVEELQHFFVRIRRQEVHQRLQCDSVPIYLSSIVSELYDA